MSAKKPKTRFQLTVGGVPKELFAVRERSADQIVILTPKPVNLGWDGDKGLIEDHISVHGGERSTGCTIKRTRLLDSGDLIETVKFMPRRPEGWATIFHAKVVQDLSESKYNLNANNRDTVIDIAAHDPRTSTFVFALVISEVPWNMATLQGMGLNFKFVQFTRFGIGVFYGFQIFPSTPWGYYLDVNTSIPRINRGAVHQLPQKAAPVVPLEVAQDAFILMNEFIARNVASVADWMAREGLMLGSSRSRRSSSPTPRWKT
ncbi:hypothetical protein [Sphingomonas sp. MMS24-J13]|uniref:hypothetical protein n=1 Tax=Sphingomonas sp. MMS24-J13 TaxID=3238686 RepID=UPI00384C6FAB